MEYETLTPPNRSYLSMSFVRPTATGTGSNRVLEMEAQPDGLSFKVTVSRPGIRVGRERPRSWLMEMEEWDAFYAENVRKGYLVTKREKMAKKEIRKGSGYAEIMEPSVRDLVKILTEAAQAAVEENYTVRVDDVSDEMLFLGRQVLDGLAEDMDRISPAEFNSRLDRLFAAVPRRIDRLADKHARKQSDFARILKEEAELLEFITGQVRAAEGDCSSGTKRTILEKKGLTVRPADDAEAETVRKLLGGSAGKARRIWRVSNRMTEDRFREMTEKKGLTLENGGIKRLFHGSRTENFWSICVNGLLLNPDAVITGKAFGNGIYFAPKAQKSIGYTSSRGSCWAHGSDGTGFLAVYRVATGEEYDIYAEERGIPMNYTQLQKLHPGADCTWARGNSGHYLKNDEVIIYREDQCTIEYLIEIAA